MDETSVKTNIGKTTGWAARRQHLVDHAPFGHWRTKTFIGALLYDRLDSLWVTDGTMNGQMFDRYVETQLVQTFRAGDAVIFDKLSSHKKLGAVQILCEIGTQFLFLPPSKLKLLIRKAAARAYEDLWQAVGRICGLFADEACHNFFKAAGYEAN